MIRAFQCPHQRECILNYDFCEVVMNNLYKFMCNFQAKSRDDLGNHCRVSDEVAFFNCIERQKGMNQMNMHVNRFFF